MPKATEKGYAYVASSDPTVFYTYLVSGAGAKWVDSGNKMVNTVDLTTPKTTETELSKEEKYYASANINDRPADVVAETGIVRALGYKVLDKRKRFAEQVEGVNNANTIFEIKDSFDLEGGSVTIPANCTLKFNGGKLVNGTIVGSQTKIVNSENYLIFQNVAISGTWKCDAVSMQWFDFDSTVGVDNKANFQNLIALTSNEIWNDVFFNSGNYYVSLVNLDKLIDVKSNTNLHFGNCKIICNPHAAAHTTIVNVEAKHVNIDGGNFVGEIDGHLNQTGDEWNHCFKINENASDIKIFGCKIEKFHGDGIDIIGSGNNVPPTNISIEMCVIDNNGRQGISLEECDNVTISNCRITNTSKIKSIAPGAGIDFEPWIENAYVKNVVVADCIFSGNRNKDLLIQPNLKVSENDITNNIKILRCKAPSGIYFDNSNGVEASDCSFSNYCRVNYGNNITVNRCTFANSFELVHTNDFTAKDSSFYGFHTLEGTESVNIVNSTIDGALLNLEGGKDIKVLNTLINNGLYLGDINNYEIDSCKIEGVGASVSDTSVGIVSNCEITISSAVTLPQKLKFYRNKIKNAGITVNKESEFKENMLIYTGDSPSRGINCVGNNIKFNFIDNTYINYKSCFVRNAGYEAVTCRTNDYIQNDSGGWANFTPLYGSKDVYRGNKRFYDGTNWVFEPSAVTNTTANRPQYPYSGMMFFDTTLGKPIFWNGTAWIDANGETVGLQVSDTSVLIGAAADSSTIKVYHANALTVSALNPDNTPATWLTVPDNIAVGTNTLTISAAENKASNPRGAKVIIEDGTDVVIVNVVQNYSTT